MMDTTPRGVCPSQCLFLSGCGALATTWARSRLVEPRLEQDIHNTSQWQYIYRYHPAQACFLSYDMRISQTATDGNAVEKTIVDTCALAVTGRDILDAVLKPGR